MSRADDEAPFLRRWSRLKQEARRPAPAGPPAAADDVAPATAPVREVEEEAREPLELPPLESLGPDSDYRPFLDPRAPATLRREALRRLWRVNPIIGGLDGLDDAYVTGDFTDKATVAADLRTLYRVGRGMADALADAAEADLRAAGHEGEAAPDPAARERG